MNWIQLIQNDNNQLSSGRVATLIWVLNLCWNWSMACWSTGKIVEIPVSVITITGIIVGGKVIKDSIERNGGGNGAVQ